MVWIEATSEQSLVMRADKAAILSVVRDVPRSGAFFPGVLAIDDLGGGRYRYRLAERQTLGASFHGEYLTQYEDDGVSAVWWDTVEGNMRARGRWTMTGTDGNVTVTLRVTTELDAPVPRFLKGPAEMFARREMQGGLVEQLQGVRSAVGG